MKGIAHSGQFKGRRPLWDPFPVNKLANVRESGYPSSIMSYSILLVDDEHEMCVSLSKILGTYGYTVISVQNANKAIDSLQSEPVDLIISDIRMPGMSGLDFLKELHAIKKDVPVIMISGYATVDTVVTAMKYGALNFYEKPIKIPKLLSEIAHIAEAKARHPVLSEKEIITQNPVILEKLRMIEKAAPTDAPVLITGESGTGKELFASALHGKSRRSGGPFVKINCASIPESLLENELFGHEKGAYTDAHCAYRGKFEQAEGGTIFLDEIAEMSIPMQAKLLRVLQEKEFERLGSDHSVKADVRIIAATNKDVAMMAKSGTFRQDLFYRLSVIHLDIPPLRERRDDIMLLTNHFLFLFNTQYGKTVAGLSTEVKEIFLLHSWLGNIRELKNCIERAVIFCEGSLVTTDDLPSQYKSVETPRQDDLQGIYEAVTREVILEALEKSGGNRQRASELLNITRRTLYNKMQKLGME